ncbi:JmjC domain-containing histone demethylation protein 1 [Haplosporangium sp. Z 767]|nr:JmjC domain-containing histone demethylation protein 1 [Haplosporangium sp. Z 11]KAF9177996.1 JmjC domain-containing histone demethylation protein 1 [Haplosporangium sp. Z 767]
MTPEEFEVIDQYHCADCIPKAGPSTLLRKSSRRSAKINYADLVNGIVSHQSKWRILLESHQFLPDKFERLQGKDLTMEWMRETGFKTPVIVKRDMDGTTQGLDMKMPPNTFTVDDVRDAVGGETEVEVMDVASQSELLDWNMESWAEYFMSEHKERVYNVISLEISGTPLADQVQRPKVVREMDWIENFWPQELKATEFPKVQLYCLMSVKDSFTDFHVDFAGSSVFYHILSGAKTFYFVEPTSTSLRKYAKWSSSSEQSTTFFGDEVGGKCYKIDLEQGDTMLIPAGWIHAVYTPESSIVIGGNFIHSLHVPMQFRISDIEMETNVSPKFRFPFFEKLNWFVACGSLKQGRDYLTGLSTTELKGLLALTVHLFNRQKGLKQDQSLIREERHMIRASVPADAADFEHGGALGVLRNLNSAVCVILEDDRHEEIEIGLRLLSEEKEKELERNKPTAPKIKLRIKLSSTPSSTNSGDEEDSTASLNMGEQQVSTITGSLDTSSTSTTSTPPKIKLKLPVIARSRSATHPNGKGSKRHAKPTAKALAASRASGRKFDDDDESPDFELDLSKSDDDEWTEFANQIDEGYDDIEDDGALELGSSDSEYDGETRSRPAKKTQSQSYDRSRKSSTTSTMTNTAQQTKVSIAVPGTKRASAETVFFGDVEGEEQEEEEEEEANLGLGTKRKAPSVTAMSMTARTSSTNAPFGAPQAKKRSTAGLTAKERIRNLLMKRR